MSVTPAISIILPIFRVEKYLAKCLDSVCNQTLHDIEVILATDGPEACDAICRKYAAKDSRISIIMRPGGYGQAINQSINVANGEYIGIVETDDWLEPFMFQKLYDMAKCNNADLCKGAFYCSFDDKTKNYTVYTDIPSGPFQLQNYPRILSYQPSVWSAIYRTEFIKQHQIYFMEERLSYLDTPFHLETLIRAKRISFVNEPLYHYYLDNPEQSVKSGGKPLDGLLTEKFFYRKFPNFKNFDANVYEGLVLTALEHLSWNYDRLTTAENKRIFWKEARSFARMFAEQPPNFTECSLTQRLFFHLLLASPSPIAMNWAQAVLWVYAKMKKLSHFL